MSQRKVISAQNLRSLLPIVLKATRSVRKPRNRASIVGSLAALSLIVGMNLTASAQSPDAAAEAGANVAAEPTVALAAQHSVVRWSGTLAAGMLPAGSLAVGKTIPIRFAIYAEQSRGLALWSETQSVKVDKDGRYSVLLGAETAEGLPQSLFAAGESRWVEARPVGFGGAAGEGSSEVSRSLLAAVPYAFKSVDAETLAGRAATDYVTREDLKFATPPLSLPGGTTGALSVQPAISGTGTTNYLPIWTNSTTFGNSTVYETGGFVGIGLTSPSATLDVNGNTTVRGSLYLPPSGTATASAGSGSHSQQFGASAYSSSTSAAVAQNFKLEALPVGNNTASPSANFALLFGSGTTAPTPTGFSIASNGRITFAAGQTFPGTGAGDITGVGVTSPLTGGGTSGSVTVGLSLSSLETSLNPVYARLAAANNFTSSGTFAGPITGNSGSTMYAIQGNTSSGYGVQGYATGTGGYGAVGYSTGNAGVGVYGNATGNANGSTYPIGVLGHVFQGYAIKGVSEETTGGFAAILGQNNGASSEYGNFTNANYVAGVWADIADNSSFTGAGILATADNNYGGLFINRSSIFPALYAVNGGSGGSGLFKTMMLKSNAGTCGVGGGNLSCTGQIKSLISTQDGARTVETYSVQSPENWLEDFGAGELHGGSAVIDIDSTFAETTSGSANYHVFLTPNGESKGLYVVNKTATSFEVRESGGGTASIGFDYRIVAKRRGLDMQRFTDVTETLNTEMQTAAKAVNVAAKAKGKP